MHVKKTIALLTIGQSPRPDVTADFETVWGNYFHILERGALDGLSAQELTALEPGPGEVDLITKLANGKAVYVSHHRLIPYIQQAIDKVTAQGADLAILLCTGEFRGIQSTIRIIQPYKVLENSIDSVLQQGDKVILLVPTQGQVAEATERWQTRGFIVSKTIIISPFAQQEGLRRTFQEREIQDAAAIIGDCFGFDTAFMNQLRAVYNKPIFIPRLLLAHLLKAIL